MISISDTATILAFAKGIGYPVGTDEGTVQAWAWMLNQNDITIDEARDAIKDHEAQYLTVKDVINSVKKRKRRLPSQIEADVRVAKKLGLVSKAWDDRMPLTDEAAEELARYRAGIDSDVKAIEATYDEAPATKQWDALAGEYGVHVKHI